MEKFNNFSDALKGFNVEGKENAEHPRAQAPEQGVQDSAQGEKVTRPVRKSSSGPRAEKKDIAHLGNHLLDAMGIAPDAENKLNQFDFLRLAVERGSKHDPKYPKPAIFGGKVQDAFQIYFPGTSDKAFSRILDDAVRAKVIKFFTMKSGGGYMLTLPDEE